MASERKLSRTHRLFAGKSQTFVFHPHFLKFSVVMNRKYERYSSAFKHKVLEEYRPGVVGCGFKALAKRFKITGGHKLIMYWYHSWDGTVQSLDRKATRSQQRKLSSEDAKRCILDLVATANSKYQPITYQMVQSHVETALDQKVSLRTVQ